MPVSLPVLQNPVTTYSAAKQNHQKDYVTVALINPKAFIFLDQFLGVFVGKCSQTLLLHNHCTLHPIDINNCASYKDMESSGENSAPDSYAHVKGINNLKWFELSCSLLG